MPRVSLLFLSEAAEQWMKVSSWRGARRFASRESIGADNQWIPALYRPALGVKGGLSRVPARKQALSLSVYQRKWRMSRGPAVQGAARQESQDMITKKIGRQKDWTTEEGGSGSI